MPRPEVRGGASPPLPGGADSSAVIGSLYASTRRRQLLHRQEGMLVERIVDPRRETWKGSFPGESKSSWLSSGHSSARRAHDGIGAENVTAADRPGRCAISRPDVVIVGGGIIGCSIGFSLAKAGVRPLILEKTSVPPRRRAGRRPPVGQAHTDDRGPPVRSQARERALYPLLADELRERRTPISSSDRWPTWSRPSRRTPSADPARVSWQSARGLRAALAPPDDVRALEPGCRPRRGAGWFPTIITSTALRDAGDGRRDHSPRRPSARRVPRLGARQRGKSYHRSAGREDVILAGAVILCAGHGPVSFRTRPESHPGLPRKGQIVVARLPRPALSHVATKNLCDPR